MEVKVSYDFPFTVAKLLSTSMLGLLASSQPHLALRPEVAKFQICRDLLGSRRSAVPLSGAKPGPDVDCREL